jgi:hypothetical protein
VIVVVMVARLEVLFQVVCSGIVCCVWIDGGVLAMVGGSLGGVGMRMSIECRALLLVKNAFS